MNKKKINKKDLLKRIKAKLKKRALSVKELRSLNDNFRLVVDTLNQRLATTILTKSEHNVVVDNLSGEIAKLIENGLPITNIKDIKVTIKDGLVVKMNEPEWYVAPQKSVSIDGPVEIKQDNGTMMSFITGVFQSLVEFLSKLQQRKFTVVKPDEDYLKPQAVAIYDPVSRRFADLRDIFTNVNLNGGGAVGGVGGSQPILVGGYTSVGDGSGSVTTAGTRVQLSTSSVPCKRVIIYNREDNGALTNGGIIVVGGATVVAAQASRRGATIFPANGMEFKVSNLNQLWLDASDNGAAFNYYYEN